MRASVCAHTRVTEREKQGQRQRKTHTKSQGEGQRETRKGTDRGQRQRLGNRFQLSCSKPTVTAV